MKYLWLSLIVAVSFSSVAATELATVKEYDLTITPLENNFSGTLCITLTDNIEAPFSFLLKTGSTMNIIQCKVVGVAPESNTCKFEKQDQVTTKFSGSILSSKKQVEIQFTENYYPDGLYKEEFHGKDYYFVHFGHGTPEKILPFSSFDVQKYSVKFNTAAEIIINQESNQSDLKKLAIVVGKFEEILNEENIAIYSVDKIMVTDYAKSFVINMLKNIEKALGNHNADGTNHSKKIFILFPRPPARNIQAKNLITQSEKHFLLDEKIGAFREKASRTALIQQISQQWFGGDVFAEDQWLETGLSTFLSYYFLDKSSTSDKKNNEFGTLHQFIADHILSGALEADGFSSSLSLERSNTRTTTYDGVLPDPILYSKGASIMRSLHALCSDEVFMSGLKKIANLQSMKVADFIREFKSCFPSENGARDFFQAWHMFSGYPVVHVQMKNRTAGCFELKQQRFMWMEEAVENHIWNLFIKWRTSKSMEGFMWLGDRTQELNVNGECDWIILNQGRTGHFRVNYDMKMWNAIISQLEKNHTQINETDRAQIIDDIFSFARSARNFSQPTPDYSMVFRLFNYLKKEKDYIPLKAAFNAIEFLDSALAGSPTHPQFMSQVKSVVEVIYTEYVSCNIKDQKKKLLEREIFAWACRLDVKNCTNLAEEYFNALIYRNEISAVHNNVEDILLCTAISKDAIRWYLIFEKLKNENKTRTLSYVTALGCQKENFQLTKLLQSSLDGHFKDYEFDLISSILNENSGNNSLILKHLSNNRNKISESFLEKIVQISSRRINKARGEELSTFIKQNLAENSIVRSEVEIVAKAIKIWDEKKVASITNLLKKSSGQSQIKPIALFITVSAVLPIVSYFSRY